MEYEELQKDSDRLKQRGAAMAKQLMEEEKMARRIKKELPKLTKMLEQKLNEWMEETGEDFRHNGVVYKEEMKNQEQEWAEYRASEMKLKLKKKQEEQQLGENKYHGKSALPGRKKTRPLGDSNSNRIGSSSRDIRKPERGNAASRSRVNIGRASS